MKLCNRQPFRPRPPGCLGWIALFAMVFLGELNAQSTRPGMGSIPYADAAGTGVTFRVWAPDATSLAVTNSSLVIYELHVGAFYDSTPTSGGPGKFTDATNKLDYLAALGVNAVELLPIAEFAGDNSWGYNPADIYAVENSGYGGAD